MNDRSVSSAKADILIVDDNPDNVRFLSNLLVAQGYFVRKALSGQMAITGIQIQFPDLILLDVTLPEMDGFEICQRLKANAQTRSIPIIFLSALDSIADKVRAFQVGGVDYITKPFQFEEVLARIQTQLTLQTLQTQLRTQNDQLQQALGDLKQAQTQLVQQEKMVGLAQLVAGFAHEINNPINFIAANLNPANRYIQDLLNLVELYQQEYPQPTSKIEEALQDIDLGFLIPDLRQLMGSMQKGVDRVDAIMLALRIFSRLDESSIKAVNLHQGIDSTLLLLQSRLQPTISRPAITVIREYDSNLPPVTCYARELNQVFLHLLNNAVDALNSQFKTKSLEQGAVLPEGSTTPAQPTIWIRTALTPSETVLIQIKDNGIGISEEQRLCLFNPFYTTKPVGVGKGLGLSISYQVVVEQHKGKLMCDSTIGQGAEFSVEIPLHSRQH